MMQEKQQIMNLTLAVNDLNRRIAEADAVATNLTSENELRKQKIDETLKNFHSLKAQFDAKEEECLELKRKYDEKNKECQHLVLTLMETQNQLSLCQIQMQPVSSRFKSFKRNLISY